MRIFAIAAVITLAGCAAFQKESSPEDAKAAETQITSTAETGAAILSGIPFLAPFAPFLPLAGGIAVQIGRLIRGANKSTTTAT